jgi:hypothetical protein
LEDKPVQGKSGGNRSGQRKPSDHQAVSHQWKGRKKKENCVNKEGRKVILLLLEERGLILGGYLLLTLLSNST